MKVHRPENAGLDIAAFVALMLLVWTAIAFAPAGWIR